MAVRKRVVQGAYISVEAKDAFRREAQRAGIFPSTLVSEMLESKAREIIRWELRYAKDNKRPRTSKNKATAS